MKRIFVLLIFLLLNIPQSCTPEHYLITDIQFALAEIGENRKDKQHISYRCTSTVKDKLVFVISNELEFVVQNSLHVGNACYATSVPQEIDNPLLEETFSLKFDKPFKYDGRDIAASSNIFDIKDIRGEIDMYENYSVFCGMGADKVIDFSQTFFDKATLTKRNMKYFFLAKLQIGKHL